jgi:ATP-binding cassette, subfamily C (CFTR/MRP), member 1
VLKQLSFTVEPGTKVGVVGRTGAGKSTIGLSISRIVELCEGRIEIDGVDIGKIDLQQLRKKVTVISQDTTLFKGTLRFNLDPFRRASDHAIETLLIKAGLSDLLEREENEDDAVTEMLNISVSDTNYASAGTAVAPSEEQQLLSPNAGRAKKVRGINFKIAENGSNLSAGEKQLICICRAILRKNKIVVLDEATANIDIVTEKAIQQLINEEFQHSTVITIAHRLNTIMNSDKVLVLEHGQIAEYDSPKTLMMNPNSKFAELLQEIKRKKREDENYD